MVRQIMEVDRIDPPSTKARVVVAVLVILMFIAILFSEAVFDRVGDWIAEDPDQTLKRFDVFIVCIAVLSMPLLLGGALTFRSGSRSVAAERYPPAGMWLIVKTPVVTGPRAKRRGRKLQVAGVLMCALAIGFPLALWRIIHVVAGA